MKNMREQYDTQESGLRGHSKHVRLCACGIYEESDIYNSAVEILYDGD